MENTLLPSGLRDVLPPCATAQRTHINRLLETFAAFGYQEVCPPLVEYTDTLFAGKGETQREHSFRFADSTSSRMLGLRSDMTTQISRIARGRLESSPLPLRLSYAGEVLRTHPEKLGADRLLVQAGIEMIGAAEEAGHEVVVAALEALEKIGLKEVVVNLSVPGLLNALLAIDDASAELQSFVADCVNQKDFSSLPEELTHHQDIMRLAQLSLPTLLRSDAEDFPFETKEYIEELKQFINRLQHAYPHITLTLDMLETTGFWYQDGICFSLFSAQKSTEIGRGGHYLIHDENQHATPAVGLTLYAHHLLDEVGCMAPCPCVYVPHNFSHEEGKLLRSEGYATLHALPNAFNEGEARTLGCTYMWSKNGILPLALTE